MLILYKKGDVVVNLNDTMPNTGFTLNDYMEGRCHLFAMALNIELGYKIEMMWDDNRFYFSQPNGKGLEHAYCVKPDGKLIDIRGEFTKDEIEKEWFCNERRYEEYSFKQLQNDIETEFLAPYLDGELKALREYIKCNLIKD